MKSQGTAEGQKHINKTKNFKISIHLYQETSPTKKQTSCLSHMKNLRPAQNWKLFLFLVSCYENSGINLAQWFQNFSCCFKLGITGLNPSRTPQIQGLKIIELKVIHLLE